MDVSSVKKAVVTNIPAEIVTKMPAALENRPVNNPRNGVVKCVPSLDDRKQPYANTGTGEQQYMEPFGWPFLPKNSKRLGEK